MITSADIKKMKAVFATKEDLITLRKEFVDQFATKDDLKAFATKDDLKAFATKDDLKAFATKDDLKTFATKENLKAFATKEDLKSLDLKMDRGFVEIIEFIGEVKGDIMKELGEFRNEIRDINRNNQLVLNNHEVRIAHLELK